MRGPPPSNHLDSNGKSLGAGVKSICISRLQTRGSGARRGIGTPDRSIIKHEDLTLRDVALPLPLVYAPIARAVRTDDWPFGRTDEEQRHFYERFSSEMGTAKNLDLSALAASSRALTGSIETIWANF